MKYKTASEAIAANPEHPVVTHGQYCKDRMMSQARIDKIDEIILSYFNKK